MPHKLNIHLDAVLCFTKRFARDQKGATAIEYGLIVALLSIALIGSYNLIGDSRDSVWADMSNAIETTD